MHDVFQYTSKNKKACQYVKSVPVCCKSTVKRRKYMYHNMFYCLLHTIYVHVVFMK